MDSSFTHADDTQLYQLYFALRPITAEQQSSLARIEACVSHVDSWLVRNKLKVNRGKNRASYSECQPSPTPAYWGYPSIQWTNNACEFRKEHRSRLRSRNDSRRARHYHNFYLKLFFVHHKNIARIRDSLSQKDTYILVHAFISGL